MNIFICFDTSHPGAFKTLQSRKFKGTARLLLSDPPFKEKEKKACLIHNGTLDNRILSINVFDNAVYLAERRRSLLQRNNHKINSLYIKQYNGYTLSDIHF